MPGKYDYIGKHIGNYLVKGFLGQGGFSSVYVGRHIILTHRLVAIKLLHSRYLTDQKERVRFLQEARILEKLGHPHVVPIVDAGIHREIPYIVTRYLPNGSLQDLLDRQPSSSVSIEEALMILLQVGQALHYAHQHSIIHCDVKPANVLLDERGEAILSDFGIATIIEDTNTKQTATIAGSLAYMAPERFEGYLGKKGDMYSLACMAYTLFTGRTPFQASTAATWMYKHLYESPLPPTQLNPTLPPSIERAILRGMAKQRTDRYPDIATFLSELQTS